MCCKSNKQGELDIEKKAYKTTATINPFSQLKKMNKTQYLMTTIAVSAVLILTPPSSGIQNMIHNVAASVALVESVAKLLDKNDQS
jgi:hypothetical protein